MVTAVGIDPIHFGLVVTLNLAIGQQTPPVASVLIAACTIARSDIRETTKVTRIPQMTEPFGDQKRRFR